MSSVGVKLSRKEGLERERSLLIRALHRSSTAVGELLSAPGRGRKANPGKAAPGTAVPGQGRRHYVRGDL